MEDRNGVLDLIEVVEEDVPDSYRSQSPILPCQTFVTLPRKSFDSPRMAIVSCVLDSAGRGSCRRP